MSLVDAIGVGMVAGFYDQLSGLGDFYRVASRSLHGRSAFLCDRGLGRAVGHRVSSRCGECIHPHHCHGDQRGRPDVCQDQCGSGGGE